MNFLNQYEIGILDFIRDKLSCTFLDKIMPIVTSLADAGIFWIVLAVLFIFFKKTRKAGISMGIALVLGLIFGNGILKPLVARTRPYDLDPSIQLLIERLTDYSFPSGHTLASFEGAGALFLWNRKLGIPAIILAAIIAFSRLYLYVHYPTDVFAGIILGLLFAFIGYITVKKVSEKLATGKTDKA